MEKIAKCSDTSEICKVDGDRRLVFGWGQICTKNGAPYYDTDNEHFPEDVSLDGWTDFMKNARAHKAMHKGTPVGEVVYAFPAYDEILKSLGFDTIEKTGIIVGVYVNDDTVLEKFQNGTFKGFSIGGSADFLEEE